MSFYSQLPLLLWKNMLLQKRKLCVTIFEILLPLGFAFLILTIHNVVKPKVYPDATIYPRTPTSTNIRDKELGYTPNGDPIDSVMQRMVSRFGNTTSQNNSSNLLLKGFKTEDELVDYYKTNWTTMQMALVFKDLPEGVTSLPLKINCVFRPLSTYAQQWKTSKVFPALQYAGPRYIEYIYRYTKVVALQAYLTEALIEEWNNLAFKPNLNVSMKRIPYPPYTVDTMVDVLQNWLRLFLILSFTLSVIQGTKAIVYEKEKGLKEAMKLMGLRMSAHWTSWFITSFLYLAITMGIYSLLFGLGIVDKGPVLAYSDATVFYVFLLFYATSIVTYCALMSTMAQKANTGAVLSGVVFLVLHGLSYYTLPKYEDMSYFMKLLCCLNFNDAMAFGAYIIGKQEGNGNGVQWNNFYKATSADDHFSLSHVLVMLFIDSIIYISIAWYIDKVWPGEFGVPQPFNFCFTKSYWCGSPAPVDTTAYAGGNVEEDDVHFEKEPEGLQEGVRICNLRKTFGTKVAVNNVSLRMYNDQITVLLGHNGAGKTTTMSMLTGFIPVTSGTAYVNGIDIRKDIDTVRKSLGLCPQHNILFDSLTVEEHLVFYAKLKGCPKNQVNEEVNKMITEVGLAGKKSAGASTLSGGQKRKLCVGIALISNSKVVILDEPSSGMDPSARRQTWEVLQRNRAGRSILLTTHYMDEADVLGDRIAIMAEGVVKCCGTSLFLKKLYGAGYHLVIVKTSACKVDTLTQMIQSCIPTAQLENEVNSELTYLLPDNQSAAFPTLFRNLQNQKKEMGIRDFGATATTMEEVFLKVGESSYQDTDKITKLEGIVNTNFDKESVVIDRMDESDYESVDQVVEIRKQVQQSTSVSQDRAAGDVLAFSRGYTKLTGNLLILSKLRGLIMKKIILLWRQRIMTILQLLVPVLFAVMALASTQVPLSTAAEPALTYNLKPFGATIIPYASNSPDTEKVVELYKSQFGADQTTVNVKAPQSMTAFLLEKAREMGTREYRKTVIVGAEFNKSSNQTAFQVVSYYSGLPFHAKTISLAYTLNALAKYYTNKSNLDIQMGLHPFPRNVDDEINDTNAEVTTIGFVVSFFLCIGLAILSSSFAYSLIKERAVGAKHMQVVCGASPLIFWVGNFIVDFINYLIPVVLLLGIFAAYGTKAYVEEGRLGIVLLVLVAFGWAILPFTYVVQFFFTTPATGLVVCIMFNIIVGLVSMITVMILELMQLMKDRASEIDWAFLVFSPSHCLGRCFSKIYSNYLNHDQCVNKYSYKMSCLIRSNPCCKGYGKGCEAYCIEFTDSYLDWELPGIGRYVLFMIIQGIVYMAFAVIVESKVFRPLWTVLVSLLYSLFRTTSEGVMAEDDDVAAERQRINTSSLSVLCQKDSLVLVNLFRQYGNLVAVDHTCLGVPEQECFGLLGQNGAGKTTTFRMLTGDEIISGGNAYLKGDDIKHNITKVQANLGYCPQFDALLEQMTGRETLTMYARLRGVPEIHINKCINSLVDVLLLSPHVDNQSGNYSGGNKRKLSTAMALIGDPPFIMLDEPSSGMDPAARRQLWNVLSGVRASGKTMVLTSHSMEECEALCTRLAIMVNGKFVCLGSTQHLKSKFGQGYTLEAKMEMLEDGTTAPIEPLVSYIQHSFPSAMLFESHGAYMHMQIKDPSVHLADVFEVMEYSKINLHVQTYNVHQTALEQVFLSFTQKQTVRISEQLRFSKFCPLCS